MDGLRPEFGWVCAVAVGSWVVHHMYMGFGVGAARKKYGVKFPTMYAEASHPHANAFNCIQRGHQNCLEGLPSFLSLLLLAGFRYPVTAAAAGALYLVGKVLYFNGYSSGTPGKRQQGAPAYIGLLTLLVCVGRFSYQLLTKA